MNGMGWDDSLLFPLDEFFWVFELVDIQTPTEKCTFLLSPMQCSWEKWFVFSGGMGRMWLIPTVKANAPKELCAVLASDFSIQYLASQTQMPLRDLLDYSKLCSLGSKADKSLESPTSEVELWQGETTKPRWRRWTWHLSTATHAGRLSTSFPWIKVLHPLI